MSGHFRNRFYAMPRCACPHCGYDATTESTVLRTWGVISGRYWREHKCPYWRCERRYWSGTPAIAIVDQTNDETITRTYYSDAFVHRWQTPAQRKRAKYSNDPFDSLDFDEKFGTMPPDSRPMRKRGRPPRLYQIEDKPTDAIMRERRELWDKLTALHPPINEPQPWEVEPKPEPQPENEDLDAFFNAIDAKLDSIVPIVPEPPEPEPELSEDDLFVLYLLHPELKEEDNPSTDEPAARPVS